LGCAVESSSNDFRELQLESLNRQKDASIYELGCIGKKILL